MPKEPIKTGRITPKVSQKTIDSIKAMGMTKALAGAKTANRETKEALTRMYGAARVEKALATPKGKAYGPGNVPAYRPGGSTTKKNPSTSAKTGAYGKNNTPKYQPATATAVKKTTKKK